MNCAGAGGTGGGTARSPASPCWCLLRWVTATTSETGPVKHRAMPAPVTRSPPRAGRTRSEEHTSELQSLMRISYAVFCLKTKQHRQPSPSSLRSHTHHKPPLLHLLLSFASSYL